MLLALVLVFGLIQPVTVHAASKPSITTQPSNKTGYPGQTVKFTVKATGAASYQWQFRTSASGAWKNTSSTGAKTATLSVPVTASRNGYQYRCQVKNSAGTTNSSAATLTVKNTAPVITAQPKGITADVNQTVQFTVKATGAVSYQWQFRTSATGAWKKASATGAQTATISVPATASRNGYQYRCRVTNAAGTTNSKAATLNVKTKPLISKQPVSVEAIPGSNAVFSVTAKFAQSYQWQYRTSSSGSWKNTSAIGSKTSTLTVPATANRNGYQYRCKVTNQYGTAKTKAATLHIKSSVTITSQPVNRSAVEGTTVEFNVAATGSSTVSYQWQYRTSSSGSWKNASATGNKTTKLTVPATDNRNGYQYRCKVTCGGTSVYSNVVKLTVTPIFTITSHPADLKTSPGKTIEFSVAVTSDYEVSYQWQFRTGSSAAWQELNNDSYADNCNHFSGATSATLSIYHPELAITGSQYRCAITVNGITRYSKAATLELYPGLSVTPNSESGNHIEYRYIAPNEPFSLEVTVTGGIAPYQYTWYVNSIRSNQTTNVFTETMTDDILGSGGYANIHCVIEDSAGNAAYPAHFYVYSYTPISFSSQPANSRVKMPVEEYDFPMEYFTVSVSGGNPDYTKYQWQYSFNKSTWTDVTIDNSSLGSGLIFASADVGNQTAGNANNLIVSGYFLVNNGDSTIINNGGLWLRCVVTDTNTGRTITSVPAAWSVPMTATGSVSGYTLSANVSGGLGAKTYKWYGKQGQYYALSSTSTSVTMENSRWSEYRLDVTDAAGFTTSIFFSQTGEVLNIVHY